MKQTAALALLLLLAAITPSAPASAHGAAARQAPSAPAASSKPKLIVMLSVDQMRGDYIDKFRHQWTKGLHRLVTEGAWFRDANYPYYTTVTCAGHASIGTGTVPAVHGMVANTWADRNNARTVSCTDDETAKLIPYAAPVTSVAHSANNLMAPTLSDEMRYQSWPAPRVVGISLKARSAINLSGHRPDVVVWLDERDGGWVTSTAFAKAPARFLQEFFAKHSMTEEMGRTWNRSMPADQYLYEYSKENRRRTPHASVEFPHVTRGRGDEVGGAITDAWEASPYSDAYLNAMAMASLDAMKLGRGAGTDFLAISFSALDLTGHSYGPLSHEVQDVLFRLDEQIGLLLDKLDRDVGRGQYVVGLSADHGVAPVPEAMKADGFDAGRVAAAAMGQAVDAVLARELGPGSYRTRVLGNDVYLNDGIYAKLLQNPAAMEAVLGAVRRTEGVFRVYRKDQLSATDPLTRQLFLSHYEGRSGDIKFLLRAYWINSPSTSTHGTGNRYDTHVPVLLYGFGIKKGEYLEPSAPIDLAPTLAFLSGVTLPNAMGRVLTEALQRR
ncbi:MAG: alkaline phosphatase family protein [Cyanobacteria bacterium]|nr:alkaline phosphatase family protein [Cyanobacteriota bacterium]